MYDFAGDKKKHREVKYFAHGHTDNQCESWKVKPDSLTPEPVTLTTTLELYGSTIFNQENPGEEILLREKTKSGGNKLG